MNWLQKLAQWWKKHPDYDAGNHLHAAFSVMLPEAPNKEWTPPLEVFYVSDMRYRYEYAGRHETNPNWNTKYQVGAFFFLYNDRMYRLDVVINNDGNALIYMKGHGFEGSLSRVYDKNLGVDKAVLTDIKADNPKDFVDQVIAVIRADRQDDNDDDEPDLIPDWPEEYNEDEFINEETEEEMARIRDPRIRGVRTF